MEGAFFYDGADAAPLFILFVFSSLVWREFISPLMTEETMNK
jgi:hypothetical protein